MASALQTALQEAANLKEATLKDRPSRQAWERAPAFFKWTCGNYPHVLEARALPGFEERLSRAEAFKEAGNQLFVEDKLDDALIKYSNAVAVFVWFHRLDGRSIEHVELRSSLDEVGGATDAGRARQHLGACFLNAAAVLLRRHEPRDAIYCCTKSLEYQPGCAKAHFRRAQARIELDTTYDLELAVKDLQSASQAEPGNSAIRRELALHRKSLATQTKKDRATFGNMFRRGTIYDAPAAAAADDALGWIKPPFSEGAKRQAQELGIDLDDPLVREQLMILHKRRLAGSAEADAGDACSTPASCCATECATEAHAAGSQPLTFLEWWQQLFRCQLQWRWHYLIYLALWFNALWRTYNIVFRYAGHNASPHKYPDDRWQLERDNDF